MIILTHNVDIFLYIKIIIKYILYYILYSHIGTLINDIYFIIIFYFVLDKNVYEMFLTNSSHKIVKYFNFYISPLISFHR